MLPHKHPMTKTIMQVTGNVSIKQLPGVCLNSASACSRSFLTVMVLQMNQSSAKNIKNAMRP